MEDTISRKAAIEALQEHRNLFCDNTPETFSKLSYAEKSRVDELDMAIATLINLPSAQPELETVKCIIGESCMDIGDADFSMKCAKCGAEYYHVEYYDYNYNFCPNCGRRWRKQGG